MKKILFICFILFFLIPNGCSKQNKDLFVEVKEVFQQNFNANIVEDDFDFFAKDLVIISDNDNHDENEVINSVSSLLIDLTNKQVVYANNVYEQLYPASLTKLVTALVVLNRGELMDNVTIGYNAANITESGAKVCGFKEGDIVSLKTLLNSALVYSGNDACIAIAEHLAGSEEDFAKLMNEEVKKLGALNSNFENSHGLHDDNHFSTVYDIYLIFNELIKSDIFLSIINQSSYTANYYDKDNNPVEKNFNTTNGYFNGNFSKVEDITILGGKTGYTSKAGNCLVLLSKDDSNDLYISVLLKSNSSSDINKEMNELLNLALTYN